MSAPLPPVIEPRDQAALLDEMRRALAGYVPELRPADGSAALGVMHVFARYAASLGTAMNQLPARQRLAFLDMLGAHLLPARAARVPLVFSLLEDSPRDVTLPAGSQAAAVPPPAPPSAAAPDASPAAPLVFATEGTITLARARLATVHSVDPGADRYADHSSRLATGFTVLGEGEPTEHALYLGHDHLFALAGDITVLLLVSLDNAPDRPLAIAWEYLTDAGWLPLERDPAQDSTLGLRRDGQVALRRACGPNAKQEVIFGHRSFWVRGRLLTPLPPSGITTALPVLNDVHARLSFEKRCLAPEVAFADGALLDTSKDFLPFGAMPARFAAFYIGSKEVFQRPGARVTLTFTLSQAGVPGGTGGSDTMVLAWEYFDGTRWSALTVDERPAPFHFNGHGVVAFNRPAQWAESEVNGKRGWWMRVRITAGDFGAPVKATVVTGTIPPQVQLTPDTLVPPVVQRLDIGFSYLTDPEPLDHCVSYNDFVFDEHTEACRWPDQVFTPFRPLSDTVPTLHLGFDRALPPGLVSLYADVASPIDEEPGDAGASPYVWEYASPRGWTELGVRDETAGLRRSGMIQLVGAPDAVRRAGLGGSLFRVRARLKRGESRAEADVNGLWLNAVWASQRAVAQRELLGTSDGNPGQGFRVRLAPLLDAELLEVQEWTGRGEGWRLWIDDVPAEALRVERDIATGEATSVWVRWASRPHLYRSGPRDRHYTVERATGAIRFGDDRNGATPPAGRRIVISYTSGGGVAGNVPAGTVRELRAAVAYLKQVGNPIAASGGADVERNDAVVVRGAQGLRHRQRAIAPLDVEWLAREASPAVARARCLPITGPAGHAERGWITVVIVPNGTGPEPRASAQLRRDVQRHLAARVPAAVSAAIRVIDARFVRIGVRAEVVPVDAGAAALVEALLRRRLDDFLHPLRGAPGGQGWEFGETVHLSRLAMLIEGTPGVDRANALSLVVDGALQGDDVPVPPDGLPTFGDHELRVTIGGG